MPQSPRWMARANIPTPATAPVPDRRSSASARRPMVGFLATILTFALLATIAPPAYAQIRDFESTRSVPLTTPELEQPSNLGNTGCLSASGGWSIGSGLSLEAAPFSAFQIRDGLSLEPARTPAPVPSFEATRPTLSLDNGLDLCPPTGPTATATTTVTATATATTTPTPTATIPAYEVATWCAELALTQCGIAPTSLTPPVGSADPFGSIGSDVSVDASGAARWTVQIDGPQGGPGLGVDFSSQRGDGELGVGFALTGTSEITRCPRTMLYDGRQEPVNYAEPIAEANWCLDGAPLDAVGQSTGIEYFATSVWSSTELQLFTGNGLGTSHFVVEDADGINHLYQPIVTDRLGTDMVFSYVRTMTEDTFGNIRSWHWSVDTTDGLNYQLEQISWGGNLVTKEANLWGARIFRRTRPVRTRWIDGVKLHSDEIVTNIIVASLADATGTGAIPLSLDGHAGADWVADLEGQAILDESTGIESILKGYIFVTSEPVHDSRLYLESAQLCEQWNAAQSAWELCFEPTAFTWTGVKADSDSEAFAPVRESANLYGHNGPTVPGQASAFLGGEVRGPLDAQGVSGRRSFAVKDSGMVEFRDTEVGVVDVAAPPASFTGDLAKVHVKIPGYPSSFEQMGAYLNEPAGGVDVLRFVTDRDYFLSLLNTPCTGVNFINHGNVWTPDTLLDTGFAAFSCGIDDKVDGADGSEDNADEASLACGIAADNAGNPVEPCYDDNPDFIGNRYFDALQDAFGGPANNLIRAANGIFGDFDGDGLEDRLRLDLYNPTNSSIELSSGVTANLPAIQTPVPVDTDWGNFSDLAELSHHVSNTLMALNLQWMGITSGDFNGDGRSDIYRPWGNGAEADRVYITQADATGNLSWTMATGPVTDLQSAATSKAEDLQERTLDMGRFRFISANGDRCPDLYFLNSSSTDDVWLAPCGTGSWVRHDGFPTTIRTEAGFSDEISSTQIDLSRFHFAEFNGDGCTDVYEALSPELNQAVSGFGRMWYSTCAGTFVPGPASPVNLSYSTSSGNVAGHALFSQTPFQMNPEYFLLAPDELPSLDAWLVAQIQLNRVRVGDVNADGLADFVVLSASSDPASRDTVLLNKGDGSWITMDGGYSETGQELSSNIVQRNTPSNVLHSPFWHRSSKTDFDLSRYQLVPHGDSVGAGMWAAGQLVWSYKNFDAQSTGDIDCTAWQSWMAENGVCFNEFGWFILLDHYFPSSFDQVELTAVTNGTGTVTDIAYDWYRSANDTTAPTDATANARVATRLSRMLPATSGGTLREVEHATEFTYSGLEISRSNGSKGFAQVVSTEVLPEGEGRTRTTTKYEHRQHLVGTPHTTTVEVSTNCSPTSTDCSWQRIEESRKRMNAVSLNTVPGHESRSFTAVRLESWNDCRGGVAGNTGYWGVTATWSLGDKVMSLECQVDGPLDQFGNPAWTKAEFGDGRTEQVTLAYLDDHHRRYSLPTTRTVQVTDVTGDQSCTLESISYGAHLRATMVTEPLVNDACATTGISRYESTTYNTYGVIQLTSTGGTNTAERETENHFGTGRTRTFHTGVAQRRSTAGSGQWIESTQTPHQPDWEWTTPGTSSEDDGNVLAGDRLLVTNTLDEAGRLLSVVSGTDTTMTGYRWNDTPSAAEATQLGGATRNWTVSNRDGFSYEVLDRVGRVVRTAGQAAAGLIVSDTWYDDNGRASQTSPEYLVTDDSVVDRSRLLTVDAFDELDRPLQRTDLSGVVTTHSYDHGSLYGISSLPFHSGVWQGWFTNDRVVVDGVQSVVHIDSVGRTVATTNALGETSYYRHNAAGTISGIQDAAGNLVAGTYDNWDRMTALADPDMGAFSYEHNAFGEVTLQTDAINGTTETTFDLLGRPLTRVVTDASGSVFDTETRVYDISATANNAWGKLAVHESNNERVEYHYDAEGRLTWTEVDGDANGNQSFVDTHVTYDAFSRPLTTRYEHPDGAHTTVNVWDVDSGELVEIEDLTGHTMWAVHGFDSMGTPVLFEHGNGTATYRQPDLDIGQLTRIETRGPAGTTIQDIDLTWNGRGNLDSLTNTAAGLSETFTYDNLDRLATSQVAGQGVVNYAFDTIGNLTRKTDFSATDYAYGASQPHAVTAAGVNTYTYRSDGLLEWHYVDGVDERAFAYTPDRKLESVILRNSTGANPTRQLFAYGNDSQRIRQASRDANNNVLEWSWYLDENVRHTSDGVKVTIASPIGVLAEFDGTDWLWMHTDHLGSTEAVTDGAGVLEQRLGYAPFGQPRDPATGTLLDDGAATAIVEDGYTGHDRLDDFGLVNMRARMYDPALGRFIQPDTIIQAPFDNQTLARYSYTRGNPLRYNDPSGHTFNLAGSFAHSFAQTFVNLSFGSAGLPAPQLNYQSFNNAFAAQAPQTVFSAPPASELAPAGAGGAPVLDGIQDIWLPAFAAANGPALGSSNPQFATGAAAFFHPGLLGPHGYVLSAAIAAATRQPRHFLGPDAISVEFNMSFSFAKGGTATPFAGVLVLRGPDAGLLFTYEVFGKGYGIALPEAEAGATAYYYNGHEDNFSIAGDWAGKGYAVSAGASVFGAFGVGLSWASVDDGQTLYGFSIGVGVGVPGLPGSATWQETETSGVSGGYRMFTPRK